VALARDGQVLYESAGDPARTHGQRLPGDLVLALEGARVRIEEVDLLAVAAGPGSFTGIRVGIATVQGLAMARALTVVPVSTLDALARAAAAAGEASAHLAAWMDAQRGEVYAALYRPDRSATVCAPTVASASATLDAWADETASMTIRFAGDGAVRYREPIEARYGGRAEIVDPAPALAGTIALMAGESPHRAVPPHALVPIYVRRPDAELARARRESSTPATGA
jgi:tRNA threonylcarbamoyladenosine biosynthesis protein TsaB